MEGVLYVTEVLIGSRVCERVQPKMRWRMSLKLFPRPILLVGVVGIKSSLKRIREMGFPLSFEGICIHRSGA